MFAMIRAIQKTQTGFTVSLMRIAMGWILFTEGTGKLLGWFHGPGIANMLNFYNQLNIPFAPVHAYLVGYAETICGVLLLIGLFTRLAALPVLAIQMASVAIIAYLSQDVHHNHLMGLAMALVLLQLGGGPLSLDHLMTRKKDKHVR